MRELPSWSQSRRSPLCLQRRMRAGDPCSGIARANASTMRHQKARHSERDTDRRSRREHRSRCAWVRSESEPRRWARDGRYRQRRESRLRQRSGITPEQRAPAAGYGFIATAGLVVASIVQVWSVAVGWDWLRSSHSAWAGNRAATRVADLRRCSGMTPELTVNNSTVVRRRKLILECPARGHGRPFSRRRKERTQLRPRTRFGPDEESSGLSRSLGHSGPSNRYAFPIRLRQCSR
jgi:hypothetical protein